MLFFNVVKRFGSIAVGLVIAACQEPDPNWGDVNGIWGKTLPGEQAATTTPAGNVAAPTTTLKAAHATDKGKAGGAPAPDKPTDCMGCHTGTPGPKFSFGGRIESAGAGVANVVVTVTGLKAVKSDADGYFWSEEGDVAQGAKVSVQKGTDNPAPMGTPLGAGKAGGACLSSTCHGGGQGPIHP